MDGKQAKGIAEKDREERRPDRRGAGVGNKKAVSPETAFLI